MYQTILWVELLILFAMKDLEWLGLDNSFVKLMAFGASNLQSVIVRSCHLLLYMLMLSLPAVCSVPTKPDNGIIVSDEPYFIESNATFTCEEGFGVNGDGSITCLSDLTWSGSSPTCDRELLMLFILSYYVHVFSQQVCVDL